MSSHIHDFIRNWWTNVNLEVTSDQEIIKDLENRLKAFFSFEKEEYIGDYGPSEGYVEGFNHMVELVEEKFEDGSYPQEPEEPEMTFKISGEVDVVSYKDKYYFRHSFSAGDFYWYRRYIGSPNLIRVEDLKELRLVEELYGGVILDTGGVVEEAQERGERIHKEKEEVLSNLKTSLQELANGDVRPIDDVMEEVKKLQEKDWNVKIETDYLTGKARHKMRIVDKDGNDYKPIQEPEENEWKSVALTFGKTMCDILPYGYYSYSPKEWLELVMNSFEEQASHWLKMLGKHQNLEKKYKEMNKLQEKTWYIDKRPFMNPNWSSTPYTPEQTETSLKEAMRQAINDGILPSKEELEREAENDIKLKNLLKAMDEYFESNKPPTLKELFEEYLTTKVDWAQSHHVTANELVDVVKGWMPSSHSSNSYEWEKCLKMLREGLR